VQHNLKPLKSICCCYFFFYLLAKTRAMVRLSKKDPTMINARDLVDQFHNVLGTPLARKVQKSLASLWVAGPQSRKPVARLPNTKTKLTHGLKERGRGKKREIVDRKGKKVVQAQAVALQHLAQDLESALLAETPHCALGQSVGHLVRGPCDARVVTGALRRLWAIQQVLKKHCNLKKRG
jgi:hypothetical protein